ncbi:MAG: TerB N-terminal domain-containing protein [Deltaproteobacteria bacterium]|nr:TerB N-terminal domain-containing protein [Deltaproteobacteria bacterium]
MSSPASGRTFNFKWYGPNQTININDYLITGGMIYVGTMLPAQVGPENDASLINPELKVVPAEPWQYGEEMGNWPKYGNVSAQCRGAYLKWLATDRCDPKAHIGYVFLFFYGLERRIILGSPKGLVSLEERGAIVMEVQRLLSIYNHNGSFNSYATRFLFAEYLINNKRLNLSEDDLNKDYYIPELVQYLLAQAVANEQPISAKLAYNWYSDHPDYGFPTPARRCPSQFYDYFSVLYHRKFGEGLIVKPNKTKLSFSYKIANISLAGPLVFNFDDLSNPYNLSGPIRKIDEVAQECSQGLEAFSRYLGRKGASADSLAAQALLPRELLSQTEMNKFLSFYLSQRTTGGLQLTPFKELYGIFGGNSETQVTKKDLESLCSLCDNLGYGIMPDIRYYGQKIGLEDSVVIWPKGHGRDFSPSESFLLAGIFIRLGALVSQSDGVVADEETALLNDFIENNRDLTKIEKESLRVYIYWCLNTPQGVSGLKQKLSELSDSSRHSISRILLAVAQADGIIDPNEVKALEKLYISLGLDKSQVISDLHAMASESAPVSVAPSEWAPTYAIDAPRPSSSPGSGSTSSPGLYLNQELIRIREKETSQVKKVLEGVFIDSNDDSADDASPEASPASSDKSTGAAQTTASQGLSGLDEPYAKLLMLMSSKTHWDRQSVQSFCDENHLMLDGALEVINEWAFDRANAPLIEDGDPIFFDTQLAKEIIDGSNS